MKHLKHAVAVVPQSKIVQITTEIGSFNKICSIFHSTMLNNRKNVKFNPELRNFRSITTLLLGRLDLKIAKYEVETKGFLSKILYSNMVR